MGISACALAAIWLGHAFVPALEFPWAPWVALAVFVAAVLRLAADCYSLALNSAGRVRDYAVLNIAYALATLAACWAGGRAAGLTGGVIAMAGVSALFLALRRRAVRIEAARAGSAD